MKEQEKGVGLMTTEKGKFPKKCLIPGYDMLDKNIYCIEHYSHYVGHPGQYKSER